MTIKYKQYYAIKRNGWKNDAKNADKRIKYCPSCKRCYEMLEKSYHYANNIVYLDNFPSYKKERRICTYCVEEDQNVELTE